MALDASRVREASLARVHDLGFPSPPGPLPVLWERNEGYALREQRLILERAAVLNVVVARTFGMPQELGIRWLDENGLRSSVTEEEEAILSSQDATDSSLAGRVEAIWCLMWTLRLAEHLDPTQYCGGTLVHSLPDLKAGQTFADWRGQLRPTGRHVDDVAQELDLYYCLTWGLANSNLTGQPAPGEIDQFVLWQRRHALEWVLVIGDRPEDSWDHVDLST